MRLRLNLNKKILSMIFGKMYELLEFNASQIACSIGIQMQ